jgi:hypothetical protein
VLTELQNRNVRVMLAFFRAPTLGPLTLPSHHRSLTPHHFCFLKKHQVALPIPLA